MIATQAPSDRISVPWQMSGKKIEKSHANVVLALKHWLPAHAIRFDETRGRILACDIWQIGPDGNWTDSHTTRLTAFLELMGLAVPTTMVDRAVELHAKDNGFNPIKDELEQCARAYEAYCEKPDHPSLILGSFERYFGVDRTPATRAAERVFWLSLAARGTRPGTKCDTVLVLIGPQGRKKSTAFEVIAGGPDRFGDSMLPIGDKDAMQIIRGKLLWEIGENAGIGKIERERVKAFLSQRVDTFRASYGRHTEDIPRTTVFVISSNDDFVLNDPTGNRRYMVVRLPEKGPPIDVDALKRDRELLLGEAVKRVFRGEPWWPNAKEEERLFAANAKHDVSAEDPWIDLIGAWLARVPPERLAEGLSMQDVTAPSALGMPPIPLEAGRLERKHEIRIGLIMTNQFGFERTRVNRAGGRVRLWVPRGK